jgi:putative FmdB family regulatory protein
MAIYEFQCEKCGSVFDVTRPMSQAGDPAVCPSCGGGARKLVSAFASTEGYGVKGMAKGPFRASPEAQQEKR